MGFPRPVSVISVLVSLLSILATLATMVAILSRVESAALGLEHELERLSSDFQRTNRYGFEQLATAALARRPPPAQFYRLLDPDTRFKAFRRRYRAAKRSSCPKLKTLAGLKRPFKAYRKAYERLAAHRRTAGGPVATQHVVAANWVDASVDLERAYHRAYRKFLAKTRTIERRGYRGLLATVAVFAFAFGLQLILLTALALGALEWLWRRLGRRGRAESSARRWSNTRKQALYEDDDDDAASDDGRRENNDADDDDDDDLQALIPPLSDEHNNGNDDGDDDKRRGFTVRLPATGWWDVLLGGRRLFVRSVHKAPVPGAGRGGRRDADLVPALQSLGPRVRRRVDAKAGALAAPSQGWAVTPAPSAKETPLAPASPSSGEAGFAATTGGGASQGSALVVVS